LTPNSALQRTVNHKVHGRGRSALNRNQRVSACLWSGDRPPNLVVRRMRHTLLALSVLSMATTLPLSGQEASVEMDEAIAKPILGASTTSIKRGFSIREFNYYEDSNDITELSCRKPSSEVLQITGKATSGHTNETYSFRIDIDASTGSYKYSDTQRKDPW
jgi:hypothetical protein